MDYLAKFNATFREFMNDLIKCFPADEDFRMYKLAISAAMMLEESMVIKVFNEKVIVPFADKILAKDDTFFMQNSYEDLKGEYSEAEKIINKLKGYWTQMSVEDKDTVIKYFVVLVKLGQRYFA